MSEECKDAVGIILAASLGACCIAVLIVAFPMFSEYQRYKTYLEAQRTVLECRSKHAATMPERICGPVPTLESFK